jgi:hypothetical protein
MVSGVLLPINTLYLSFNQITIFISNIFEIYFLCILANAELSLEKVAKEGHCFQLAIVIDSNVTSINNEKGH